ncbi:MAG: DUF4402 domain-containing protein [Bacteroidales bacterium]
MKILNTALQYFRMKCLKSLILYAIVFVSLNTSAQGTISATAYAQIVPLIGVTEIQQLSFGQFSPIASGGSITITPQGSRTTDGSVVVTEAAVHQGVFSVSGTQDNKLNVLLPITPVYIYHQNGVNFMYLDSWTVEMPNGGTSESNKNFIVNIGSTIHVSPIESNPIGFYLGTYPVVFFYN